MVTASVENNPVPNNFLSRQNLDDYLLEILLLSKKDEIFSDEINDEGT